MNMKKTIYGLLTAGVGLVAPTVATAQDCPGDPVVYQICGEIADDGFTCAGDRKALAWDVASEFVNRGERTAYVTGITKEDQPMDLIQRVDDSLDWNGVVTACTRKAFPGKDAAIRATDNQFQTIVYGTDGKLVAPETKGGKDNVFLDNAGFVALPGDRRVEHVTLPPRDKPTDDPVQMTYADRGNGPATGFVAGGAHYVTETGTEDSNFQGPGLWARARLVVPTSEKGAVRADVHNLRLSWLKSDDGKATVSDADISGSYQIGDIITARLGANWDASRARIEYAGLEGVAKQWTLGPEIGAGLNTEDGKLDLDARASVAWGNRTTDATVEIADNEEVSTYNSDSFTKVKGEVVAEFTPVNPLTLAAHLIVENDSGEISIIGEDPIDQNNTAIVGGPEVRLGNQVQAVVALDLTTTTGNTDRDSRRNGLRPFVGIRGNF
jgi:hypothetical protein